MNTFSKGIIKPLLWCLIAPVALSLQSTTLLAKTSKSTNTDEQKLPFENYLKYDTLELDNGLRVIVHEDRTAPIVSFVVSYHVGSKDEPEGKTGFAHLFEHLLFSGTKTNPGEYFSYVEGIGGTEVNATTSNDFTNYFGTVPTNALERLLWIEGDRMVNTIDAITQKMVDIQIEVVKNEKGGTDNQAFGGSYDKSLEALYPDGHPYAHTVIGSVEDVESATLEDVRRWYDKHYGARNIVIGLAGDIDIATAKPMIEKYFGSMRSGPAIYRQTAAPVRRVMNTQQKNYDTAERSNISRTYLFPKVQDEASYMPILALDILAAGTSSPLSKALVDEREVALSVSGTGSLLELASSYTVSVEPADGVSLDDLADALDEEMARLIKKGFIKSDIQKKYGPQRSRMLEELGFTLDKAFMLAESWQGTNDPLFKLRELSWVKNASTKSLNEAANEWLLTGYHEEYFIALKDETDDQSNGVVGAAPPLGDATRFEMPAPEVFTLENGLEVVLQTRTESPSISMSYELPVGTLHQSSNEREIPDLAASIILTSGLPTMSEEKQSALFDTLGLSISLASELNRSSFSLTADIETFEQAFDIWSELLTNAEFDEGDANDYLTETIEAIEQVPPTISSTLDNLLITSLWGEEFAYTDQESLADHKTFTVDMIAEYYDTWFKPKGAKLYIVGDVSRQRAESMLNNKFKKWKGEVPQTTVRSFALPAKPKRPKIIIVDNKGVTQTSVTAVNRLQIEETDMYQESVMNSLFGGGFTSRLNLNLREEKGWTYGITSFIVNEPERAYFAISSEVSADKTVDAIEEIIKEIDEARSTRPLSDAELEKFQGEIIKQLGTIAISNPDYLNLYKEADYWNREYSYYNTLPELYKDLDTPTMNRLLKEIVDSRQMVWALSGDASIIEADIRAANLGDVEVYNRKGERLR